MSGDRGMTRPEWQATEAAAQALDEAAERVHREVRERAVALAREVLAQGGSWDDVIAALEREL